jgi:hypothetical protein
LVAVGLGTGLWPNASAELWTHGLDALWLSCAMLALQRRREWLAGLALVPAIWTRPHLALVAASIGFTLAFTRRSLIPLLYIGVPTSIGLAGLRQFNSWLIGRASVEGNYGGYIGRATDIGTSAWRDFAVNMLGSLFSPLRGLVVHSPFVVLGAAAACYGFRRAPDWARGCLLGGLAYHLAQWRLSPFTGGTGYFSYRYSVELIMLAAPVAVIGYQRWQERVRGLAPAMRLLVGLSVATHVVGVFWYHPLTVAGQLQDPWTTWGFWLAANLRGTEGLILALTTALLVVGAAQIPSSQVTATWRNVVSPRRRPAI